MSGPRAYLAVAACFFLSGLAALVYQTAWTRELALVFGASELAVATVLAAYMAGLASGAAAGGRLARRLRRPVLAYGLLELGVGLSALAVPLLIHGSRALLLALFGGQPELPEASDPAVAALTLGSSFLVLMIPTSFMGATLPLLARHAVREDDQLGRRIGGLYAINTAGAVAGTLATAFVLLPAVGLRDTVALAVGLNALVFGVAAWVSRRGPPSEVPPEPAAEGLRAGGAWVLPLIAISGAVSFTYEVLWTRLLSHLVGGSVYAFASMLASFLLGIALGSAVAGRLARGVEGSVRWFAVAQGGAAWLSIAAFALVDRLPASLPEPDSPELRLALGAAVAIATLLPAALCIGATYPLAVRILARGAGDAGPASARTYAWNTAGAIAGALGAAYWVLPALGFEGTLRLAAGCNAALGLAALLLGGRRAVPQLAASAVVLILVAAFPLATPWHLLERSALRPESTGPRRYFAVGRSATVLMTEVDEPGWRLRTNGLAESVIQAPGAVFRGSTAGWMSALPALLRDRPRTMAVVGLGGGANIESVPRTFEDVEVVEIEPEVLAANQAIGPERARDPLSDPRVRVRINDARSALLLTGLRFDAVVAQPSHPWTAGSSHLYTREFFELVASRLTQGGIFVQWMGPSFVDLSLLRSLVATLRSVWPHVRVYRPPPQRGLVFVASAQPLPDPVAEPAQLGLHPEDFLPLGILSPVDLAAAEILDEAGAEAFARGAPLVTDDRNLLQMRSPFVLADGRSLAHYRPSELDATALRRKLARRLPGAALVARLAETGRLRAARELARVLPAGRERRLAEAMMMRRAGRPAAARARLERLLAEAPDDQRIRAELAELIPPVEGRGGPSLSEVGGPDSPEAEQAVAAGLRALVAREPAKLQGLEPALARVEPTSPFFCRATLLRAEWRIGAGPERAAEALKLIDRVIPAYEARVDLLLARARAAGAAGDAEAVIASARHIVRVWRRRRVSPVEVAWLRNLVATLPRQGPWSGRQKEVVRALDRLARSKRVS